MNSERVKTLAASNGTATDEQRRSTCRTPDRVETGRRDSPARGNPRITSDARPVDEREDTQLDAASQQTLASKTWIDAILIASI